MTRTFVVVALLASSVFGATSFEVTSSPFGGNGHNVSFDGRLFIVRTHPGWEARVFRPEAVTLPSGQPPQLTNAFSAPVLIQAAVSAENALAMCEVSAQPLRCDANGTTSQSGTHRCYEFVIIDSNAEVAPHIMRRRQLLVVVSNPNTASAAVHSFTWLNSTLTPLSPTLRGIEPTVTRDGRLLVWQGHPNNSGATDTLVYSVNQNACATTGWTAPRSIAGMATDPLVVGRYRLAERPLRDPAGVAFSSNQVVYGAYPWIFPEGEALNFTAVNMPCRATEDPPGCGPRRNALSFIGYPTNWQVAHVDGALNPATDNNVRLFFSSPGPANAGALPITQGLDVWPFFGTNTSNYGEVVFDDALDGRYAGLWHLNEFVTAQGTFDLTRAADSSGYSNTGLVRGGATFPSQNNGAVGKALSLDGQSGRLEVPHASSLSPVNAITVELWLKPRTEPNCDGNNNYRLLIGKPNINGAFSLALEENRSFRARVRVAGGILYDLHSPVPAPLGQWTHVAFQYDAATGAFVVRTNGVETARSMRPPALLAGTTDTVFVGSGGARAACPPDDGAFDGEIDEVAVSRIWRYGSPTPGGTGGGAPGVGGGSPGVGGGTSGGATAGGTSGGATAGGTSGGATAGGTSGGATAGGTSGGATAGGTSGGATAGGTSGGSSAGGRAGGTAGGATSGGTSGGATAGGTSGGSSAGGRAGGAAGGATAGGTSGGATAGGTSGGATAGGTSGGETAGGTSGGETAGGTSGGASAGGTATAGGGATAGGTAGGSTSGGRAGGSVDGGARDAGVDGTIAAGTGCGCSSADPTALFLLSLVVLRRAQRSRRRSDGSPPTTPLR